MFRINHLTLTASVVAAALASASPASDDFDLDLDGSGRIDQADVELATAALAVKGVDQATATQLLLEIVANLGQDTFDRRLRKFGLSRDRIEDLGQGRFRVKLDPAVGTQTDAWLNGALEWEYVGQAEYILVDQTRQFERVPSAEVVDDGPTDTITRLLRTEMEDEHGRLFRVKRVDRRALVGAIDRYEDKIAEDFRDEEPVETTYGHDPALDPVEVGGTYTPLSWYREDQDGDGDKDRFRWNSDNRNLASSLTDRMQKVVTYFVGNDGDAALCSGVLVGERWVLTAAHCAKDGTTWVYPRGQVCTNGAGKYSGSDCGTVTARWGNGSYSGEGDFGDDIVVMKINDDLGASGNYMALSRASNSTLKSYDAYVSGYPGLTPGGSNNCTSYSESGSLWSCEMWLYWMHDDVNHTSTKKIGTKNDVSAGMSGCPIYYYPSGVSAGTHYLTGIMGGHHQGLTKSWNGGAKIPYHRDWVLGIID